MSEPEEQLKARLRREARGGGARGAAGGEEESAGLRRRRARRTRLERRLDDRVVREHVLSVGLVELVFHRVAQRVELRRGEAVDEHRRARDVVDGVGVPARCEEADVGELRISELRAENCARKIAPELRAAHVRFSGRQPRASEVFISSSGMKRTHCSPVGMFTRCGTHCPWHAVRNATWKPP